MKHTEYIIPIGEDAQDYDEMFIGVIRRQPELVRCKDCKHWKYEDSGTDGTVQGECCSMHILADGMFYCAGAEREEE